MAIYTIMLVLISLAITILLIYGAICAIKSYNLLRQIVESGAIPSFSKYKLRKQAEEIIASGHIDYLSRDNTISLAASLHQIENDPESQRLAEKLDEMIKAQPAKQG
jgi:hypothetical protein